MHADSSSTEAINAYLAALQHALHGADAALVHDAIVDAETHLRSALAAGKSAAQAIADYGSAEEVAHAYVCDLCEAPGRPAPAGAHVATDAAASSATSSSQVSVEKRRALRSIPVVGVWFDPHAWGSVLFLLFGFFIGTAAFVWTVAVGSAAIGLLPTLLGIPLLILLLGSTRMISLFLGQVIETFVGIRMPRRMQSVDTTGTAGFWRRIWVWVTDVRSWLTVAFFIGNFPVAVFCFCVTVVLLALGGALTVGSVVTLFSGARFMGASDGSVVIFDHTYMPDATGMIHVPVFLLIGLALLGLAILTASLWLSKGVALLYGQVVKSIQVVRPQPLARG
ncbi:MAG: hypothetical protein EXS14_02515 [Planctomycetes bacterium]|nr:hypothetical protein [Planctomycetota bacterium]